MPNFNYLYSFKYDYHHSNLCKLESRQLFNKEEKDKVLLTDVKVDPSISPFIRNRLTIISTSIDYSKLIDNIKKEDIHAERFNAEYIVLKGDVKSKTERRKIERDVGYNITGEPDFNNPTVTYSVCYHEEVWYFGILAKHQINWHQHKKKPCSFSNSIGMNIAKALVSIGTKGDKNNTLIDTCCGVGTIMLEACISDFKIEGCDINPKTCGKARKNLAHYNYNTTVYYSDIKDLNKSYDISIIDLPYNIYSYSTDEVTKNIINSSSKMSKRVIIVSVSDIEPIIMASGLEVKDFCIVEKRGYTHFTRKIWVCEPH